MEGSSLALVQPVNKTAHYFFIIMFQILVTYQYEMQSVDSSAGHISRVHNKERLDIMRVVSVGMWRKKMKNCPNTVGEVVRGEALA